MNKQIYLVRGTADESYPQFRDRIISLAESLCREPGVARLSLTVTESGPPRISVIPFRTGKIASISVHAETDHTHHFQEVPGASGAFWVNEEFPVAYTRDWSDLRTPGVCLLTLFRQKKNLSRAQFLDRWHNGHTPLSLKIHPLWHYSRNEVKEVRWKDREIYDGIVEEHTRQPEDLLNPFRFFGDPVSILPNMIKVYFDVRGFLDYGSIEPYLTREYVLKSNA